MAESGVGDMTNPTFLVAPSNCQVRSSHWSGFEPPKGQIEPRSKSTWTPFILAVLADEDGAWRVFAYGGSGPDWVEMGSSRTEEGWTENKLEIPLGAL